MIKKKDLERFFLYCGKHFRENGPSGLLRMRFYKGFLKKSDLLYDRRRFNESDFINDWARLKIDLNQNYRVLLDDKLIFDRAFRTDLDLTETLAVISEGKCFPSERTEKATSDPIKLIEFYLQSRKRIVVKTVRGHSGKSVWVLNRLEDGHLTVNGHKENLETFLSKLNGIKMPKVISTFIEQGAFPKSLYAESVNTIRLVTLFAEDGPFVAAAVQRIGTLYSRPVDNFSLGGLSAWIHEDGTLGSAVRFTSEIGVEWFDSHPDTGEEIRGKIVCNWKSIKSQIIDVASNWPMLKIVGWDIVQLDKGIIVIEGNNVPEFHEFQVHKPLLCDKRTKTFFKRNHIV